MILYAMRGVMIRVLLAMLLLMLARYVTIFRLIITPLMYAAAMIGFRRASR